MKSYREEFWFETKPRRDYINITPQVEAAVRKSDVRDGMAPVNAMHITASAYIHDDERGPWEQIFYGEFDGRRRSAS